MWLIVGLGNPGLRYANDRHNIGFQVIDHLAQQWNIPLQMKTFQSVWGQGQIPSEEAPVPVGLVTPQTYMNLSGEAVAPFCRKYEIPPERVLVIHDELDLEFGHLRLKRGGGTGGHNGLRSIQNELDDKQYLRLRFGVGRPSNAEQTIVDYVLSPFTSEEKTYMPPLIQTATDIIRCCCTRGILDAMNEWNQKRSWIPQERNKKNAPPSN